MKKQTWPKGWHVQSFPLSIEMILILLRLLTYINSLHSQSVMDGDEMASEKSFAFASFAFAAVTGFCIGGTALANVIGIPYINKRLTLSNAVIPPFWL